VPLLMTPSLDSSVERSVRKLARDRRRRLLRKEGAIVHNWLSQQLAELTMQARQVGAGLLEFSSDHNSSIGRLRIGIVAWPR
jgi:hypothetical protein